MDKRFKVLKASYKGLQFKIEEDIPEVGWYIYKYDAQGNCTHDFLQENMELAIECAKDEFGVPPEIWK